jgi:MFS family permease
MKGGHVTIYLISFLLSKVHVVFAITLGGGVVTTTNPLSCAHSPVPTQNDDIQTIKKDKIRQGTLRQCAKWKQQSVSVKYPSLSFCMESAIAFLFNDFRLGSTNSGSKRLVQGRINDSLSSSRRSPTVLVVEAALLIIKTPQRKMRNALMSSGSLAVTSRKVPKEYTTCSAFFVCCLVWALPIFYVPAAAAHLLGPAATPTSTSRFVTTAASLGLLGAAVGKVVNGFVCQAMGGPAALSWYMIGMGLASLGVGFIPTTAFSLGLFLAGIEFMASMQWLAHSSILSVAFSGNALGLARSISLLSLGGTAGTITAKLLGAILLQNNTGWRSLAILGGLLAFCLGLVLLFSPLLDSSSSGAGRDSFERRPVSGGAPLADHQLNTRVPGASNRKNGWPRTRMSTSVSSTPPLPSETATLAATSGRSLLQSLSHVLGSRRFWMVGLSHSTVCLASSIDKVLGTFIRQVTLLSPSLCGGLTLSLTVGFVHGLSNTQRYHDITDVDGKVQMLRRSYVVAIVSTLALAACGLPQYQKLVPSSVMAAMIAILTAIMGSSLSFQYYQLPNVASSTFGQDDSICLSFFDALGFLVSAGVWATFGWLISNSHGYGWSLGLSFLAALYAAGATLLLRQLPELILAMKQRE